jgi:hypothetical protein
MADLLTNSRRRFDKFTYTPIRLGEGPEAGDVIALAGAVRAAELAPAEIDALGRHFDGAEARTVAAIRTLVTAPSADRAREATAALGALDRGDIMRVLLRAQEMRGTALEEARRALASPPPAPAAGTVAAAPASRLVNMAQFSAPNFRPPIDAVLDAGVTTPALPSTLTVRAASSGRAVDTKAAKGTAAEMRFDTARFREVVDPYVPPGSDESTLDPIAALEEIARRQRNGAVAIDALQRRTFEPLGLLHLETLQMTPEDVERGELVYSLPLAPKEKVTLTHKEWAVRETEFTEYVQDFLENFSEKGVVETDEIAIASETESRRTDRTSVSSTEGLTITGPVDGAPGSSVVTNSQSQRESRSHARSVTTRASSRSVRDHRVSFTVATTSGVEDFTARLLENAESDRAMRVDYFRRMRKWQLQLFRTGVRLTYDVVIPDPGRRLRARHELLRRYDMALAGQFDPGVSPSDINEYNYMRYADGYEAVLQEPLAPEGSAPYRQWQMASYATLRDAAFARFTHVQEIVRQRRAELAREIETAADPQHLRRMEREQVMRSVLEWLIPGFGTSVVDGGPASLKDAAWLQVMEYGEYIKFVHSAIDWTHLSYVLYPYFWAGDGMEQLFLRHTDPHHREFLRAGSARVFLPVQPGRELEWAALLDQGRFGTLPQGHRFVPILEEVSDAHAAYAKEIEENADEPGTKVGEWTEYTPTGALDIDVVMMPLTHI